MSWIVRLVSSSRSPSFRGMAKSSKPPAQRRKANPQKKDRNLRELNFTIGAYQRAQIQNERSFFVKDLALAKRIWLSVTAGGAKTGACTTAGTVKCDDEGHPPKLSV